MQRLGGVGRGDAAAFGGRDEGVTLRDERLSKRRLSEGHTHHRSSDAQVERLLCAESGGRGQNQGRRPLEGTDYFDIRFVCVGVCASGRNGALFRTVCTVYNIFALFSLS